MATCQVQCLLRGFSANWFLGALLVCASGLTAQLPPQPSAPAGATEIIPKDVINMADRVNIRNGPYDPRNKKAVTANDTCLLPPLTVIGSGTIAAQQLQIPAKAQKAYLQACVDLSKAKLADAEKHLRQAVHESAKYTAAWVTLGQLLAMQDRRDQARQACTQAAAADAKYVPAFLCVADLAARGHDWQEVLNMSQHAAELDTENDPVAYEYKAAAELNLKQLPEAEKSALRAIEADKDHVEPRVFFVLAQIYEAESNTAGEIQQLHEYLKYAKDAADVAAVQKFLETLENPAPSRQAVEAKADPTPEPALAREKWAPPDIDEKIPPVRADVNCPLPEILQQASTHTQDLIESLQRFSADERIEQVDIDKSGKNRATTQQVVNYVAQVVNNAAGYPTIHEYRAGNGASQKAAVIDSGSAIFALIFHPTHLDSFQFRCEGMAELHAIPAWQVHFEESPDPAKSFQAIQVGGIAYLPRLKGRAWIAAKTYEVMRMEVDLADPISRINFTMEHLVINYAPVDFKHHSVRLWLPESTALYVSYRGHNFERTHYFRNFQLFSVDSDQAVKSPVGSPETTDSSDKLLSTISRLRESGQAR